jgi:hypothetical protein
VHTLDTVLTAPSGAVYPQLAKQYNQVTICMPCQDWGSLEMASLVSPRAISVEILRPRLPNANPCQTLWIIGAPRPGIAGSTDLGASWSIHLMNSATGIQRCGSPLMIQSLGILHSDNMKSWWSIISMNPSAEILRSTGLIIILSLGSQGSRTLVNIPILRILGSTGLGDSWSSMRGYPNSK